MNTELQRHIEHLRNLWASMGPIAACDNNAFSHVIAAAERCEAGLNSTKDDATINVRLFDLVRYMRGELIEANLITREEYAWLCAISPLAQGKGSPSPRRLESYDELRKRAESAEALCAELKNATGKSADILYEILADDDLDDVKLQIASENELPIVHDTLRNVLAKTPAGMGKELAELRADKARLDFLLGGKHQFFTRATIDAAMQEGGK